MHHNKIHTTGTRAQVYHGTAKRTTGGLTKSDLMMNKHHRIVSKAKHNTAKKEMRLVKYGYGSKKGKFGYVKIGSRKHKKMSGGLSTLGPADINSTDITGLGKGSGSMIGLTDYPGVGQMDAVQLAAGQSGGRRSRRRRGGRKSRSHRGGMNSAGYSLGSSLKMSGGRFSLSPADINSTDITGLGKGSGAMIGLTDYPGVGQMDALQLAAGQSGGKKNKKRSHRK
jgi:hypothetical protein